MLKVVMTYDNGGETVVEVERTDVFDLVGETNEQLADRAQNLIMAAQQQFAGALMARA